MNEKKSYQINKIKKAVKRQCADQIFIKVLPLLKKYWCQHWRAAASHFILKFHSYRIHFSMNEAFLYVPICLLFLFGVTVIMSRMCACIHAYLQYIFFSIMAWRERVNFLILFQHWAIITFVNVVAGCVLNLYFHHKSNEQICLNWESLLFWDFNTEIRAYDTH